MNDPMIFKNPQFGEIRAVDIDGEPWFVGKDIAQVLGYGDTDQALRRHVDDEDKLTRQINGSGQSRAMTFINESGLYSLILSSKLPTAKVFKRWVTSQVLPSIRKHGGYIAGQEGLPPDQLMAKALLVAQKTMDEHSMGPARPSVVSVRVELYAVLRLVAGPGGLHHRHLHGLLSLSFSGRVFRPGDRGGRLCRTSRGSDLSKPESRPAEWDSDSEIPPPSVGEARSPSPAPGRRVPL